MSESKEEELIGALWVIAAVVAFGFGYSFWGWVFVIKGGTDQLTAMYFACKSGVLKGIEDRRKANGKEAK